MEKSSITVIGLGYIGLPLGVFLALSDYKVNGMDINKKLVDSINQQTLKLEPDIDILLKNPKVINNLSASIKVTKSSIYIICVPTPVKGTLTDLSYVHISLESITKFLKPNDLIIIESTIPPGTCRNDIGPAIKQLTGLSIENGDIGLVYCPERVLPGNLHYEFINNSRIIGCQNIQYAERAAEIYGKFVKGKIVLTDDITAEFCKTIENTYRDVNIALANEIKMMCDQLGVEAKNAIEIANMHPRVNILQYGIGVGGHCIPVDPYFLINVFPEYTNVIKKARDVNNSMPNYTAIGIINLFKSKPKKLVLIGRTYKPNVIDERNSPALEVIRSLEERHITCNSFDPYITNYGYNSILNILDGAEGLIVLVPHKMVINEIENNKVAILSKLEGEKIIKIF